MANPAIYAPLAGPIRSVADYQALAADTERSRTANALAQFGMRQQVEQQQAQQQRANALMEIYRQSGGDPAALRAAGYEGEAQAIEKHQADIGKTRAEAAAKDADTVGKRAALWKEMWTYVRTPDDARRYVRAVHMDPAMAGTPFTATPPEQFDAQLATMTPEQFEQFRGQVAMGVGKWMEANAPKYFQQNLGGTNQIVSVPGLGGPAQVVQSSQVTQSPDNKASVGAQYANAAAAREQAAATRDAAREQASAARETARLKDNRDTEMKLADDYRQQSKLFGEAKSAYEQIQAALPSATKSPVATLAAATKFMKIIDPGSVVRESELGMALAASGVLDRAANYMNTLTRGKVLTASQAKDFENISKKIYAAAQKVQKDIDKSYTEKAKTYGLRPEMIVQELGQNSGNAVSWDDLK